VAIGRAFLGRVVGRFGLRASLVLFPMLGAVLVVAGLVVEQFWIQIVLWSALGLCLATIYPNILAAACLAFPSKEGTACGLTYAIGIVGSIVSPAFIGGIAQQYSLGFALIFVLISLVLVAGLAATLSRIKEARVRMD
jgi:MFS family permease